MSDAFARTAGGASDFVAGFVARHAAPIERLRAVMDVAPGFTPGSPSPSVQPVHFRPQGSAGPKHFSPADPTRDPTEGWDPLDPTVEDAPEPVDAVETARAEGYAEGLAAATADAAQARARDEALIAGLAAALAGAGRIDREAMASRLRSTVLLLVTRLVGESGVSADLLAARVDAATKLLADEAESALLRLHPDDVALVEGRLPDRVFAAGDAGVARGSFVLESASTVVEDGPEMWLEQLAAAIDRVPLPC
ncbi:MAG TPA: FliH/SctL family protein [Sphingomonas sp.]|jgi:flagellar assembly protein FliH